MKRIYTSPRRDEVAQVKRILEEHLVPCLMVTNGDGDWRIYLNIATYALDYQYRIDQASKILRDFGFAPAT